LSDLLELEVLIEGNVEWWEKETEYLKEGKE